MNDPVSGTKALEVLQYVDAIEIVNGACSEQENLYAHAVAQQMGIKGLGGSDSHSAQSLGCAVTILDRSVSTVQGLIEELRATLGQVRTQRRSDAHVSGLRP